MATNVIPSDTASIFDALSASQKNALAYPSPFPPGMAGLVFDWTGDEKLELRSDITDSWIESNTAINDQIALMPERFTLDASTAEVVYSPASTTNTPSEPLNPFPTLAGMTPCLTPGAAANLSVQAVNGQVSGVLSASISGVTVTLAAKASTAIGQAASALTSLADLPATLSLALTPGLGADGAQTAGAAMNVAGDSSNTAVSQTPTGFYGYYEGMSGSAQNEQGDVMGFIYQLWKGRCLFTVETPWGIFTSMAIEMSDAVQPANTPGQTDHHITFKKVRIAQEITVSSTTLLGRAYAQATESNPSLNGGVGTQALTSQESAQQYQQWAQNPTF